MHGELSVKCFLFLGSHSDKSPIRLLTNPDLQLIVVQFLAMLMCASVAGSLPSLAFARQKNVFGI